jgi:hypothetical protein
MYRPLPFPYENNSIFGDTYKGVANPNTVVVHGYPTRFHGPVFTMPMPGWTYKSRPYVKAPFMGIDTDALKEVAPLFAIGAAGLFMIWVITKTSGSDVW